MFITNAANLMTSIMDLLKALKSAQELTISSGTERHPASHRYSHPHGYPIPPPTSQAVYGYPNSHTMTQSRAPIGSSLTDINRLSSAKSKALCIDDSAVVCQTLYPLSARWKTLGTFLHIDHNSLEVIDDDERNIDNKLSALVAKWLRRNTPPATWQALYEAVQYIDPNQAQLIRDRGMAEGSTKDPCSNLARSV